MKSNNIEDYQIVDEQRSSRFRCFNAEILNIMSVHMTFKHN